MNLGKGPPDGGAAEQARMFFLTINVMNTLEGSSGNSHPTLHN